MLKLFRGPETQVYQETHNRRDSLLPFVVASVALHLLFLILLPLLPSTLPVPEFLKKKAREEEKRPIYVKILDMPKPKKEEAPPKNAHIISQFNTRKKGPKGKQLPSYMSGDAPVLTPKPGPPIEIPGTLGHPGSKPSPSPPLSPPSMEKSSKGKEKRTAKQKPSKEAAKATPSKKREKPKKGISPKPTNELAKEKKAKGEKERVAQKEKEGSKEKAQQEERQKEKAEESRVVVKKEPNTATPKPSTPPVPKRKIPLFDPSLINQYAKRLNPQMDTGESVTLELDTKKSKYISYFRHIREKLYLVWRYPTEARMAGIQGVLRLLFVIDRSGHLTEVKLLTSSGYTILDNEAIRAIRAAAPFGPFPSDWREKELRIKARFIYHLYQEGFQ